MSPETPLLIKHEGKDEEFGIGPESAGCLEPESFPCAILELLFQIEKFFAELMML